MNKPDHFPSPTAITSKAKFRPPTVDQIDVAGFFGPRLDVICSTTASTLFDRCIEIGMLDQIDPDRPNPGIVMPFEPSNTVTTQMFWDSDMGKAIETAAYCLSRRANPELEATVDQVVDAYGRLQQEDGYLNSWYIRIEPGKRWTNLRDRHELYNAGHLIEGAVAYYYATGKRRFLDIMSRFADHIGQVFGPGPDQRKGYPGHPELELALIRLGRATGEKRYLELARYFVDQRGQAPSYFDQEAAERGETPEQFHFGTLEYCQAHKPVREQTEVVGHAVRAAYLYAGMADVATEFSDDSLTGPLNALWSHLVDRNLYVTGGFGPSEKNEGLTFDYDLPNETAYAETCASVALVFWASRMLGRGPDAKYADVMEQALYNNALAGLSLDGTRFFYDNPLESRGNHHRWTWHRCPCCPANISRLLASVGTYCYGVSDDEVAVHLYNSGIAKLEPGGHPVTLKLETNYPFDGNISIEVAPERVQDFTLSLRVPGWCDHAEIKVNGTAVPAENRDGYLRLSRAWQKGDVVTLELDLSTRRVFSHPRVTGNQGRIALMHGPLVYCLEQTDNGELLNALVLPDDATIEPEPSDILGGIVKLQTTAMREMWHGTSLYNTSAPARQEAQITAVPYYAWGNREAGEMLTWIRREQRGS